MNEDDQNLRGQVERAKGEDEKHTYWMTNCRREMMKKESQKRE